MMSDWFEAHAGAGNEPVELERYLERYDEARAEADGLVWLYTEEELALGSEPSNRAGHGAAVTAEKNDAAEKDPAAAAGQNGAKAAEVEAKSKARFEWATRAASQFRMALERQRNNAAASVPRFTTEEEVLTSAELIEFVERLPLPAESCATACIAEETKSESVEIEAPKFLATAAVDGVEEKVAEQANTDGEIELSDTARNDTGETSPGADEERNENANGAADTWNDSHGLRDNDWVEYAPGHFQQRFILAASPLTYTAPDNKRKKRWFMRLFGLVAILLLGSMLPPMMGRLHAPGARPSVASEAAAETTSRIAVGLTVDGGRRVLTVMAGKGETSQHICERFLLHCDASVMDEMGKLNPDVKDLNALEDGQLIKVPVPAARKTTPPALP